MKQIACSICMPSKRNKFSYIPKIRMLIARNLPKYVAGIMIKKKIVMKKRQIKNLNVSSIKSKINKMWLNPY